LVEGRRRQQYQRRARLSFLHIQSDVHSRVSSALRQAEHHAAPSQLPNHQDTQRVCVSASMWGSLVVKRRLKLTASSALHSTYLQYRSMRICGWLQDDARRLTRVQSRGQDLRSLDLDTHPTRLTRQRSPRLLSQLPYCPCAVSRATNDCKWCYSQLWILKTPFYSPYTPGCFECTTSVGTIL
jgi:hypothetical protein